MPMRAGLWLALFEQACRFPWERCSRETLASYHAAVAER